MADQQSQHAAQTAIDSTIATAGLTSPMWLGHLERGLHWYLLVGGAALLTWRLIRLFKGKPDA